ncbi:MAG: exo-beta-N-acetylmuramidase NamZ domain-containing protein [Cyclonatronaceae bacterium]
MKNYIFGTDFFAQNYRHLRNRRIGLLTNDAARPALQAGITSRKYLLESGFRIIRLFSPEHGIAARAEDGAAVADITDPVTDLPVVSLYGERLRARAEDLRDLDLILYDVPDAGARFFTYNWSMSHMLEACAENGIPFCILDRPNPTGGTVFEGPMQDAPDRLNFLGRAVIPVKHGITTGELALLLNREWSTGADLTVVKTQNWKREMLHQTRYPFHRPSPALQTYDAVVLYPGLCLFESVNMSIGRGTDASFLQVGSPWLKPDVIIEAVSEELTTGVTLTPVTFTPGYRPWENRECRGIRLAVDDAEAVRPVALALALMAAIKITHGDAMEWTTYPTAANPAGVNHFMRLTGCVALKNALDAALESLLKKPGNFTGTADWDRRIHDILLYTT